MKPPLRYFDDPILRKRAKPIQEVTSEVASLAKEMLEIMLSAHGVGLAAPQVGQLLRLFIIRDEREESDGNYTYGPPQVILNPTLSNPSEEKEWAVEGCLSLPGLQVEILRPKTIHLRYQTLEGLWVEELLEGHRARVVMHENDHLNGVLIIDRLSKQERRQIEPQLRSIKRKYSLSSYTKYQK